jgi:predicted Mrr-cat superfamily restriction endonuclease
VYPDSSIWYRLAKQIERRIVKNIWCIRANFGAFANHFVNGGYVAIGYDLTSSLAEVTSRDEITSIYKAAHPEETSNLVVGQQVGQVARFLLDIKEGDYVVTPAADTDWLHYGRVNNKGYWFEEDVSDGCPDPHRKGVDWSKIKLSRSSFSVPFQNTIRSSLTVFAISQQDEFLTVIKADGHVSQKHTAAYDPYESVLEQVLELDDKEFEILVGYLLTAIGFEESQVTGKTGDGGVDATGILNVANLAKVKVFVQAKRYKRGSKINANVVKQLRTAIPVGGQGAFITTADFQSAAAEVAIEAGFPRIGLINGKQLVDLLVEHWQDLPTEFRDRLGLRIGLIRA